MRSLFALIATIFHFIHVESRSIPTAYNTIRLTTVAEPDRELAIPMDESPIDIRDDEVVGETHTLRGSEIKNQEKVIGLKAMINEKQTDDYHIEDEKPHQEDKIKEPCSIVVLSNIQNPNMQSLIRKYRYDAKGALIPSSVKYYVKSPQGFGLAPILVPLNDKAFSPLGGFLRYYKEVPPIPQSWR